MSNDLKTMLAQMRQGQPQPAFDPATVSAGNVTLEEVPTQEGDTPLQSSLRQLKQALEQRHPTAGSLLEKVLRHAREQPDHVMLLSDEELVPFTQAASILVEMPKATMRAAAKARDEILSQGPSDMWDMS